MYFYTTLHNSDTYRAAHGEVVALEEVGPASLLVHDAARPTRGQTQTLAGQLDATVLTFGHVDGTEQRLDDRPTARSVPQTWDRNTAFKHPEAFELRHGGDGDHHYNQYTSNV